jgi:hypothetical protein
VALRLLELEDRDRVAGLVIAPEGDASIEDRYIAAASARSTYREVGRDVVGEVQALVENSEECLGILPARHYDVVDVTFRLVLALLVGLEHFFEQIEHALAH